MGDFKVNPGDLVRIVAPGGRGSTQNLIKMKTYVESLELVADITDNIYNQEEPFYSNFDEFRANDLISAILNPDCKVIWCIRGGAGCNRLIPYLDKLLPEEAPSFKLLIGYSDITVLHIYLKQKYNWPTVHGAMLEAIVTGSYDPSSESVTKLVSIVFNRLDAICYPNMERLDKGEALTDPIQAPILGGNLSLVEASIGTTWEIETTDVIFFLEDISVAAYQLERGLEHLIQLGMFDKVKAVIFGDMTNPDSQQLVRFVEDRFATDVRITCPVFLITGIGHGPVNLPLPLNMPSTIYHLQDKAYQLCDNAPKKLKIN